MPITFNEKKARAVFLTLAKAWRKQDWVFKKESLPQKMLNLPQDPRDRANILFLSALLQRGPAISESVTRWVKTLFEIRPEMQRPEVISSMNEKEILRAFEETEKVIEGRKEKGSIAYRKVEFVKFWKHNSEILTNHWKADAREIFKGACDFEDAYARIDPKFQQSKSAIQGAKRKIISLASIWLKDDELIEKTLGPIPVDFHALRVLWACDIVEFNDFERGLEPNGRPLLQNLKGLPSVRVSEPRTDAIAKWSQKLLLEIGALNQELNPALWLLSRTSCKRLALNRTTDNKGVLALNSEYGEKNTCAACPIQEHCKWAVPNGPYSRFGYLVRRPRTLHPQPALPGTEGR